MGDTIDKRHNYIAYGLSILSDIELPGFLTCDKPADVSITIGKVPYEFKKLRRQNMKVLPNELYLRIKGIKFYIKDGSQIVIENPGRTDYNVIRGCITGICMSVIMLQRGFIPIHGSCVVIDEKGIILTGNSGAGKSSLCFAFRQQQYEFLSDEISVISPDDSGKLLVFPAHPQQKLNRKMLKKMGYELPDVYTSSFDGKVVINSPQQFRNTPVPLSAIFELRNGSGAVRSIRATGTEKLKNIINNTIYANILVAMGISADCFSRYIKVAEKVDYFILERPRRKDSIEELFQHIINYVSREHGAI